MKKFTMIIACILAFDIIVDAQTFNRHSNLSLQITADTTIHPFDGANVTSIGVSGRISFLSDLGFVRIIVGDGYGDDYLVYEAYKLFEEDSAFVFTQKCEESCFYETYVPTDLVIQVKDAIVNINSVDLSNAHYSNAEYQRLDAATAADNTRLSKVQRFIADRGLIWVAGHTKLSDLSYASRAQLWGRDYKSYGFEYYSGGIYCLDQPDRALDFGDDYVDNFDWRNRHGANAPDSPYYDGDEYGTGWLSPITCQEGCWENGVFSCGVSSSCEGEWRSVGTCWAFGTTAHVEALANLYYNDHLDLDLSEQYLACQEALLHDWDYLNTSEPFKALNYYKNGGVPYEACWPYTAGFDGCEPLCSEPMERVSIDSYSRYGSISVDDLRRLIMEHGPVAAGGIPTEDWKTHCMLLVGWGTIDEDSPLVSGIGLYIPENWYGVTYWIYKNSYGVESVNNNLFEGYSYVIHSYNHSHTPNEVFEIPVPVNVPGMSVNDVKCEDKDGDGYYYWGVGPKPAHCPPCPDQPDGDDSNPCLGPLNDKGQCTIIDSFNASFEHGWDNWVQYTYTDNQDEDYDWWRHSGPTGHTGLGGFSLGPQQAQNGDYYIYLNGHSSSQSADVGVIQSPPIDFSGHDECAYVVDFYYHMKSYNYDNDEHNKLFCTFLRKNHSPMVVPVAENNQGEDWKHYSRELPEDTYQILISASRGADFCNIAIDNITIGPWKHDATPIVITDDALWESSEKINKDVIIENGGKLTIRKAGSQVVTMKMHPESKIIVKPGGQLILDGCTLKCFCSTELWQGIQVWGDKTKDQYMHDGSYYQGYLEMMHGASIEDAVCAVELWNPGHWSTTGGIIIANNATFNNNSKAIHALHYKHIRSGKIANYKARFTECTFKIGVAYHNAQPFYKHVDLAHVQGVRFNGCTFRIDNDVQNISDWTIGIAAYNAGFTVDANYLNQANGETVIKRSLFSGFQRAIQSVDDGSDVVPEFTVKRTDFRKNDYGIFSRKSDYATIVGCSFELGLDDWYSCNAGIYMDNITGFAVEENSFSKGQHAVSDNFGIVVKDSQSQNQIYHNHYDGLYCANLAVGVNNTGLEDEYKGTEYRCNENTNNEIDFYVLGIDGNNNYLNGVQSSQGSDMAAARNTFSHDAYHFYNGGDYRITYIYYNDTEADNEEPLRYNSDKFRPEPSDQTEGCPSHYGNGSGGTNNGSATPVVPVSKKIQLEQDYQNAYSTYSLIRGIYERRIDGGHTNNTLANIKLARPSDMWQLRSELLGSSPYLSQNVLFAAADRDDVFSEPVLFEIMLSNPDELKKDTLMRHLKNKVHPLPGYMISVLEQVANGTSAKTVLQNQMATYRRQFSLAAGDMIRSILNDTVVDVAELRGWLGNMNDINADRNIIASYMAEGDFGNALALAEMLPSLYGHEGADLQEHNDYMELLNLYQSLYIANRNTSQLNETELTLVEGIADHGMGTSKAMAQALLEGAFNYHFAECPVVSYPEGGRGVSGNFVAPQDIGIALGLSANLRPNPATTWTTLDYTLPSECKTASVDIINAFGVKVLQFQLNGNDGQKVIDLRDLVDGIYVVTIMSGEYSLTEKLVISK